jgi:Na+-transporting NADH:ubiquinone oxidoreductase subunit D
VSRPIVVDNPIMVQVLGICAALAVTKTLATALTMGAAVTAVLTASSVFISAIRKQIPRSVRLIIQITIISTFVIIVDLVLKAFAWEMSRTLSVFVGLIVTNCIVLGRAETFAMNQPVGRSALDGLGNGLGYALVLGAIGAIRELLGAGTLLGRSVLTPISEGGWFEPLDLMLLPPSAFFLIAILIWSTHRRPAETEGTAAAGQRVTTHASPERSEPWNT